MPQQLNPTPEPAICALLEPLQTQRSSGFSYWGFTLVSSDCSQAMITQEPVLAGAGQTAGKDQSITGQHLHLGDVSETQQFGYISGRHDRWVVIEGPRHDCAGYRSF